MAESVVSFTVETIGNLLINEAKFLWGVKGKVNELQRDLGLIRRFLRDADARRGHDQAVGEWVAQLRDIAYDAEDIIERYIIRIALKKGQNIIEAFACFVAKCTCLQVHVVGTEIDDLNSSISHLRTSVQILNLQLVNKDDCQRPRASMLERSYEHFEEDFVGREDNIEELVKELLNDGEKHRVIFIWGMGGLGKTSLAKKVFAHDKVKNTFDGLCWVCVSQEYHVKDILVEILRKLIPDQIERVMTMMDDELFKTLYEIQQGKRCMVVLDDIWTKQAWDSLRAAFPVKNTRSKLLITTRNRDVAEHIDPHGFFHEPQCLSNQESWDLLKKRVFSETKGLAVEISSARPRVGQGITAGQAIEGTTRQSETSGQIPVITEDLKRLGDELLRKCGGLPLAVIVLGGLLVNNKWETVYKKINSHFGDNSDISKVLNLSYEDLPWHLKPCFLYLGSFPEDVEIPAKKVFHMWIAEGFVSPNAHDEEMEDVAEQYLTELVNRGMVQVRSNLSGKIKTCHLHDLMRELCISKAVEDSFLSILNIQQDSEVDDFSSLMAINVESTCKVRRLSLHMRMSDEGNMTQSLKPLGRTMLHLRTFMFFGSVKGKWEQFQPLFINCKFLRVLKLEDLYEMKENLPESVGDLVQLRFLSLAGSSFESLPQSMANLVCMEFLDLCVARSIMVFVPNVLWKMRRLRHLRLPLLCAAKEMFFGHRRKLRLDTLKNLRTLRNFNSYTCNANDVGKLTNLRKLNAVNQMEMGIIPLLAKFNLKHLQSSSFQFISLFSKFTEGELSTMSSYCHSCKLSIDGIIEKLPRYENLPQQLRKLVLINSRLEEDPMPILEKLPHLVVLMMGYSAFVGREMVCSAGGFPQLKDLFLNCPNLKKWRVFEGAMPHLSRLSIKNCPNLKTVPQGVHAQNCHGDLLHEYWRYFSGQK